MNTQVQKPFEYRIPEAVRGAILKSQHRPDTFDVWELIAAAHSRYDSEYRRRARYALDMPIPEQDAETDALRRASVEIRRKKLEQHARKMEKQRQRRAKDRPKRSYQKRKR